MEKEFCGILIMFHEVTYPEFFWGDTEFSRGFRGGCDAPRNSKDLVP